MRLTNHVYLVGSGSEGFRMTDDLDCHVYLIDGGSELAVVDAGSGMGVPQIVQNIRKDGCDLERVVHLLLTHAHMDHVGGARRLRAALGDPRSTFTSIVQISSERVTRWVPAWTSPKVCGGIRSTTSLSPARWMSNCVMETL